MKQNILLEFVVLVYVSPLFFCFWLNLFYPESFSSERLFLCFGVLFSIYWIVKIIKLIINVYCGDDFYEGDNR